jgi:hypothetical protein
MFELPKAPEKTELERLIALSQQQIGPLSVADIARLQENEPWRQMGLTKEQWNSAQGLSTVTSELERAVGHGYQDVINLALGKTSFPQPEIPVPMPQPPIDMAPVHEQQRRQDEHLDLQRRTVAALEASLEVERARTREAQVDKLASQKRELERVAAAETETRRWKIGALFTLAGLVIAAVSALWNMPTLFP